MGLLLLLGLLSDTYLGVKSSPNAQKPNSIKICTSIEINTPPYCNYRNTQDDLLLCQLLCE
jgi:hypothetical protein